MEDGKHVETSGQAFEHQLRRLDRDHKKFLELHQPIKASIMLALLRDTDELEFRADPEQCEERIPAIVALGEALVRKGLKGDTAAFALIAERVEGRVGTRIGDVDPEADTRRGDMAAAIEAVVTALTTAKLNDTLDSDGITLIDTVDTIPHTARPNGHANGSAENGESHDDEAGAEGSGPVRANGRGS